MKCKRRVNEIDNVRIQVKTHMRDWDSYFAMTSEWITLSTILLGHSTSDLSSSHQGCYLILVEPLNEIILN